MSKHDKRSDIKNDSISNSDVRSNSKPYNKGKSGGSNRNKSNDRSRDKRQSEYNSLNNRDASACKMRYDDVRSNDISWWNRTPLYSDVTRVPFNRIYGGGIKTKGLTGVSDIGLGQFTDFDYPLSGIMSLRFVPTIGYAEDSESPVNRAFKSLYGDIYSKTTGAMQFQQLDLANFVLSMSSIATMIAHIKRALGVSQLYSSKNYFYPRGLITSMGMDPNTIIGHQDEIRYKLNNAILSFNNLKIPDFMSIFKRQYGLAHNVYCDADDQRAQLYVFVPTGIWEYDDTDPTIPLVYKDYTGVDECLEGINSALEKWRNSSDLGLISGSIQRAYKDANFVQLDYVKDTDVVIPTVDRNIMWQVENCHVFNPGYLRDWKFIANDPVNNLIIYKPWMSYSGTTPKDTFCQYYTDYMLRSFDGNESDEFIMEATRLGVVWSDVLIDNAHLSLSFRPNTELIVGFSIVYCTDEDGVLNRTESFDFSSNCLDLFDTNPTISSDVLLGVALLHQFKYAPLLYIRCKLSGSDTIKLVPVGDIGVFTTIDNSSLIGLQEAALQSVYDVNAAQSSIKV